MTKKTLGIVVFLLILLFGSTGCSIQSNVLLITPVQVDSSAQPEDNIQVESLTEPEPDLENNNDNTLEESQDINDSDMIENTYEQEPIPSIPTPKKDEITTITISAAGDCTLGTDTSFGYRGSFPEEVNKNGYGYIFKNVKGIFQSDDLTLVNLETTLTNATIKAVKKFRFKGSPEYTKILTEGSIEAVNIANNHIHDYLSKGYSDTINSLKKSGIGYFGYDNKYITKVKDVKIGCLGYEGWSSSTSIKNKIKTDIATLRKDGVKLIIVSLHWGEERKYYPNSTQKELGKYVIDSGADLVLGHHPHVVQGIQTYKGKNIVYSLGNFAFGGNRNPSDKDTFIYQQVFEFKNGQLLKTLKTNIIPCSVSSVKTRNNYQPTPLKGTEALNIISKITKYSVVLK